MRGCSWTGSLSSVEKHVSTTCSHRRIQCPNDGCVSPVTAVDLEHHLTECSYRVVPCEYCGSNVPKTLVPVR